MVKQVTVRYPNAWAGLCDKVFVDKDVDDTLLSNMIGYLCLK